MLGGEELLSVDVDRAGILGEHGVNVELGRRQRLDERRDLRHTPFIPLKSKKFLFYTLGCSSCKKKQINPNRMYIY